MEMSSIKPIAPKKSSPSLFVVNDDRGDSRVLCRERAKTLMYIICGSYYLTTNQTDLNSVLPLLNSWTSEKDLEENGPSNTYNILSFSRGQEWDVRRCSSEALSRLEGDSLRLRRISGGREDSVRYRRKVHARHPSRQLR